MTTLEQAFIEAEEAARATQVSARVVTATAGRFVKAAQTGNLAGLRRAQGEIREALQALSADIDKAAECWTLSDAEVDSLFSEQFGDELRKAADALDLAIFEQGDNLVAYPSIIRLLSADRAVRIDRKKVSTIRPSYLAALLLQNQAKTSGYQPRRFLESLYQVYLEMTSTADSKPNLIGTLPASVRLAKIFRVMTALPGARTSYDASDFARDLYNLDTEGPRQTRKGFTVILKPPSSSARAPSRQEIFSFVGPEGNLAQYYQIEFRKAD